MPRLLVHVEGETEEAFVQELLAPHLRGYDFTQVFPRLIGNSRQRLHRGGIRNWDACKRDILRHLRDDWGRVSSSLGP